MKLPEEPIESVTVFFNGDMSVGIWPGTFDLEVFIDLGCIAPRERQTFLSEIKAKISDAYELMYGESPSNVLFDFEIKEMDKQEKELDEEE